MHAFATSIQNGPTLLVAYAFMQTVNSTFYRSGFISPGSIKGKGEEREKEKANIRFIKFIAQI